MNTLYMLVGIPGSGKSTWIAKQHFNPATTVILSTDNYIENVAKENNSTYNNMFKQHITHATKNMHKNLHDATAINSDIVWDQTNLSVSTRTKKLINIPAVYKKIAVVFPVPEQQELKYRLSSRPGKTIDSQIIENMKLSFETPSISEGFDEIVYIHN